MSGSIRPPPLFPDHLSAIDQAQSQQMLRADIGRRVSELIALGWLGRAYLALPILFRVLLPQLFLLETYDDTAIGFRSRPTTSDSGAASVIYELTLMESSIVSRGIPFRLALEAEEANPRKITAARLVSLGCDLDAAPTTSAPSTPTSESQTPLAQALCEAINNEAATKRMVVTAVVDAIFRELSEVSEAVNGATVALEACGAQRRFQPIREMWAREGTAEKWLQRVSGYYFAEALLQDVAFADGVAQGVRFTFYLDPTEPLNSDDPTRNINPEVVACRFDAVTGGPVQ